MEHTTANEPQHGKPPQSPPVYIISFLGFALFLLWGSAGSVSTWAKILGCGLIILAVGSYAMWAWNRRGSVQRNDRGGRGTG